MVGSPLELLLPPMSAPLWKNVSILLVIVSPGILWIMHGRHHPTRLRPQRFPCVRATGYISQRISFKLGRWVAMVEISPHSCFDTPRVKIMTQTVKNVKNSDSCLCSSYRPQFFPDFFNSWHVHWYGWGLATLSFWWPYGQYPLSSSNFSYFE